MSILFQLIANSILEGGVPSTSPPIDPPVEQLSISPVTSDFAYTVYDIPETGYNKRSAFSVLKVNTTNKYIDVDLYSPLKNEFPTGTAATRISIFDDQWNFIAYIDPANVVGKQTINVYVLKTGSFYFVEPLSTGYNVTDKPIGTYITGMSITSGNIQIETIAKSANRILTVGDSISVGDGASNSSRYGWSIRLRDALRVNDWSVTSQGWGAAYTLEPELFLDDAGQQKGADEALAEFEGATGRKVILWVMGTNDFGYVTGDPVNVGNAAASYWDKVNAVDNTVEVIVITPLYRTNQDTANGGGWVLQDYRDQLTARANERAFVTVYDGETILTSNDLNADGLHPSDAGHQKMADYIVSIL
jgi:lysophospholipase L1-like esterase